MFRNTTLRGGATAAVFATAVALSGCGYTAGDRIVSGGLLGAGAGAAIGSLDGNAGRGAVIGGVAGGTLGALTTPRPGYGYSRYGYYQPRCVSWSYSGRCMAWR